MRPRISFALLLALGAFMHLLLLRSPERSLTPLITYSGRLLLSLAVVAVVGARARSGQPVTTRERSPRRGPVTAHAMEGLRGFGATAAGGLLLHVLNVVAPSSQRTTQRGMWLIFFLFAIGSYMQLRGAPGDRSAPVPDGSPLADAMSRSRKVLGWVLAAVGAAILFRGLLFFAGSGLRRVDFLDMAFLAGGAMLVLAGLALVFPRRGDDT